MKITEWESNLNNKFSFEKIEDFNDLKVYLSNANNYVGNFSPSEVSEGELYDEYFYAAYILNEHEILNKDATIYTNSGWTTTIILVESKNKIDIDNYYICGMNGFLQDDVRRFLKECMLDNV